MEGEHSSGSGRYDLMKVMQNKEPAKHVGNIKRIGIAGAEGLPLGDLSEFLGFYPWTIKIHLMGNRHSVLKGRVLITYFAYIRDPQIIWSKEMLFFHANLGDQGSSSGIIKLPMPKSKTSAQYNPFSLCCVNLPWNNFYCWFSSASIFSEHTLNCKAVINKNSYGASFHKYLSCMLDIFKSLKILHLICIILFNRELTILPPNTDFKE